MAVQPSEKNIKDVLDVLGGIGITRDEAIARLKGNNNNAVQAINEFFDDSAGGSSKQYPANTGWDDSHFGADRDGTNNNNGSSGPIGTQGVSFEVQGPDEFPLTVPGNGKYNDAMSRPPSRVNNRSPLGNVIDLTADTATGGAQNPMYFSGPTQEDDDLERALAASLADAGMPPQESGATNNNGTEVHFGPATKDQYDSSKWAMVLPTTSTREILIDPDPIDRKRDLDIPAFLKPSVGEDRLAGLVTMYHAIPLTRELFLDRENALTNYGSDAEWWNGQAIKADHLMDPNPEIEYQGDVDFELQRLMAFLDKTDRSYGSVEALAKMHDVLRAQRTLGNSREVEPAVLSAWSNTNTDRQERHKQIYSRGVSSEDSEDRDEEVFAILDLQLPPKDSHFETIYDIADDLLWPSFGAADVRESSFLSHVSDVFVFKVTNETGNDSKNIEFPSVWYPDRYLFENRQAAWEMRMAKKEAFQDIQRISLVEDQLTNFHVGGGKEVKIKELFEASLRHDEAELKREGNVEDEMETSFSQQSGRTKGLSEKLRRVVASIDRKLIALKEEKEKALASMRKLSQLYTSNDDNPDAVPLTKYFLRGVSTKKDVTYICRRAEPDLIEMDLDADAPKDLGDQWWKCAYVVDGGNARVEVVKTTEEEVLKAAKEAPKQVLLMYANETAMKAEYKPLPPSLEAFVRADNALFRREFPASSDVTSPGKRKFEYTSDQDSPTARDSEREYRLNGEPELGWGGTATASARLGGVTEEETRGLLDNSNDDEEEGISNSNVQGEVREVEMQERRGSAPLLGQIASGNAEAAMRRGSANAPSTTTDALGTIDSMDLDEDESVVVRDDKVAEASPAVRKVGL